MRFTQVDVFTNEFMLGNPVAVVHDADVLSDSQMAAFARWTNLSETTFLLRPTNALADYRLRIFTPNGELPFAGHPTLGSARAWLAAAEHPTRAQATTADNAWELTQECAAGLIAVRHHNDRFAFAAPPLRRTGAADAATVAQIAAALGPRSHLLAVEHLDNGPGWVAALLPSAQNVLDAKPDLARLGDLRLGLVGRHEPDGPADVEVRAFVPGLGIPEDPVTGSLAAGLGGWLPDIGVVREEFTIRQGTTLGRCGFGYLSRSDGQVWVAGDTVIGIAGEVRF